MIEAAIGIDIGGTNTKMALVDQNGKIHNHFSFPTQSQKPFSEFIDRVANNLKDLIADFHDLSIHGIGVGAPNANPHSGMILSPPNLAWGSVPLKAALEAKISRPVWMDNDANIAAMAENIWGVAQNKKNFIVVTLGTGVGTGIFCEGKLLLGSNFMAGEGGHVTIIPAGRPCGCGAKGHLEPYANSRGIELTAEELLGGKFTSKEIGELFKNGDKKAYEVMEQTAKYLGIGLSTMVSLFSPELIVLAGGVAQVGGPFDRMVEKEIDRYVFGAFQKQTKVTFSKISTENGAVLGAASLVFGN